MRIQARFSLTEDTRTLSYQRNSEGQWVMVEGARVKLSAVQGEPFGSATPSGSMDMVIVNPEALAVFREAPIGQTFDVFIVPVEKE